MHEHILLSALSSSEAASKLIFPKKQITNILDRWQQTLIVQDWLRTAGRLLFSSPSALNLLLGLLHGGSPAGWGLRLCVNLF